VKKLFAQEKPSKIIQNSHKTSNIPFDENKHDFGKKTQKSGSKKSFRSRQNVTSEKVFRKKNVSDIIKKNIPKT